MAHMRRGAFEEAWRISDEVLRKRRGQSCEHLPPHEQWLWKGESLADRRVLVRCQHGLGDTIQFVRYTSLVKRVAARVIVQAQSELLPLLRCLDDQCDELLTMEEKVVDYDVAVEVMELAHVFRTTQASIPFHVPYFSISGAQPDQWSAENRGRWGRPSSNTAFHAGLVWAAGDWDERRSIPFELVRQLAKEADSIQWHIFQRGAPLADWDGSFGINAGADDVLEAAKRIAALDLLISVDSMPAHLAGALAVPIWTLLHSEGDWRWMKDRADSLWYPTMRLFRQQKPGDWESVIEEVGVNLQNRFGSLSGNRLCAALW
jgi:hypothetical protein